MQNSEVKEIRLSGKEKPDIIKTFECGQCFRWNADSSGVYRGVAGKYPAEIYEDGDYVVVRSQAEESFWRDYFDMNTDYSAADAHFLTVPWLGECTLFGRGIRILRQNPWEALCSFIISQCNNIPRIKKIVECLCTLYGETVEFSGAKYCTFPDANVVAGLSAEDLSPLRAGYRAPYIINAAKLVNSGEFDLEELKSISADEAKVKLLQLQGVGEKVANCAVLFGLHHMEAFPVDVWIRRALKEHFPPEFRPDSLGELAGLAQQYIFYYSRSGGDRC